MITVYFTMKNIYFNLKNIYFNENVSFITGKFMSLGIFFSWTGKMVFEGGLCLPRAVFTAPSEARAVIRPKGGKGRPRRPFCLSMEKYPWDMIFAGDDDTFFPFESHSTFLASFLTKNRSKSDQNWTKIVFHNQRTGKKMNVVGKK